MSTAPAAPDAPGVQSAKGSDPSTEERPTLLNQVQIEAEDDSVEVDSAFGSDM